MSKKISKLPVLTILAAEDILPLVDFDAPVGEGTKKISLKNFFGNIPANVQIVFDVTGGLAYKTPNVAFTQHISGSVFNGVRDDSFHYGYNIANDGSAGNKIDETEPQFKLTIEAHYFDATRHWFEWNLDFESVDDTHKRGMAYRINRENPYEGDWGWAGLTHMFYRDTVGALPYFKVDLTDASNQGIVMRYAAAGGIFEFGPIVRGDMTQMIVGFGAMDGVGGWIQTSAAKTGLYLNNVEIVRADVAGVTLTGYITHNGTRVGFYNHAPAIQPAKASHNNWANLSDLTSALASIGLIDAA